MQGMDFLAALGSMGSMMSGGLDITPREVYGNYQLSVQTHRGAYCAHNGTDAEIALFDKNGDWVVPVNFPPQLKPYAHLFEDEDGTWEATTSVAGHVPNETIDEIRTILKQLAEAQNG